MCFYISYANKNDDIINKKNIQDSLIYYTNQIKKAQKESFKFPEESLKKYQKSLSFYTKKRDTSRVINCLHGLSKIEKKKGNYSKSFDYLWEAKYLNDFYNNKKQQVHTYLLLSRLYDEFNMTKQSLRHAREALITSKKIYKKNPQKPENLIACFMYMAVQQRKLGNYGVALKYLDSCFITKNVDLEKNVDMPFWDAERGKIMQKLGQYNKAEKYLHQARKHTDGLQIDYRPNIALYLGDLKSSIKQKDSAIIFYNESLILSRDSGFRNDLEGEVLRKISQIYSQTGNTSLAYEYLLQSMDADYKIQKYKNQTNSNLFKIRNTFLNSMSEKNTQLEEKNSIIEKNEQIQFRLKVILALLVVLSIAFYIVAKMRLKLKKTLLEKKETEFQTNIIKEKSKNELELKSKELTAYALQLIDKDSAIDELLNVLKNDSSNDYKSLHYKYKKGSKDLWNEFNLQFTNVNTAFYKKLIIKHPNLSTTEQKHCALIKLNLGTKEMARILNIEPHSVHVSRSRIRKKIGMKRSENLEKYITQL